MKKRASWSQLSALLAVEEPLVNECIWLSAGPAPAGARGGGEEERNRASARSGVRGNILSSILSFEPACWVRGGERFVMCRDTHREVAADDFSYEEAVRRVPEKSVGEGGERTGSARGVAPRGETRV
jgi:hypothetical protein